VKSIHQAGFNTLFISVFIYIWVDATGSKQIRGLSSASTLEEVMAKFGYQPDDRLGRREQVVMFNTTQK
jgi:hypothetical protein